LLTLSLGVNRCTILIFFSHDCRFRAPFLPHLIFYLFIMRDWISNWRHTIFLYFPFYTHTLKTNFLFPFFFFFFSTHPFRDEAFPFAAERRGPFASERGHGKERLFRVRRGVQRHHLPVLQCEEVLRRRCQGDTVGH
jgi:hypothetical protein